MRWVQRFFCAALACLFPVLALSSTCTQYAVMNPSGTATTTYFNTRTGALLSWCGAYPGSGHGDCVLKLPSSGIGAWTDPESMPVGQSFDIYWARNNQLETSGSGWTFGQRTGNYCTSDTCVPLAGGPAGYMRWAGTGKTFTACDAFTPDAAQPGPPQGYCTYTCQFDVGYQVAGVWESGGHCTFTGSWSNACNGSGTSTLSIGTTSAAINGTQPGPGQAEKDTCDGFLGTVGGVTTCVPKVGSSGLSSTTVENSSGTSSAGVTSTSVVTKDAVCDAATGKCTVTTTTSTTSGGTTTVSTSSNSSTVSDWCAANPGRVECGGKGSGTGTSGLGSCVGANCGGITGTGTLVLGTLSAAPSLYTRTYTATTASDVGSYFGSKMAGVTAPLATISHSFFPDWSDNGEACPQFTIPLNLGLAQWNFGSRTTTIPCSVWTVCRWVIIISALFLARALIFGG